MAKQLKGGERLAEWKTQIQVLSVPLGCSMSHVALLSLPGETALIFKKPILILSRTLINFAFIPYESQETISN